MVWTEEDKNTYNTQNPSYTITTESINTIDTINVYMGKLGKEQFLMKIPIKDDMPFADKKDLIVLPRNEHKNDVYDSDVYVVKQTLIDYVHHEYNIFVELYNWEN